MLTDLVCHVSGYMLCECWRQVFDQGVHGREGVLCCKQKQGLADRQDIVDCERAESVTHILCLKHLQIIKQVKEITLVPRVRAKGIRSDLGVSYPKVQGQHERGQETLVQKYQEKKEFFDGFCFWPAPENKSRHLVHFGQQPRSF